MKPSIRPTSFLLKLFMLSVPALLWFGWQASLPINQYTFRMWEALINQRGFTSGPLYPRISDQMTEVGGMAAYSHQAVPHLVHWTTDAYGNRNSLPLCTDPEIVILGDSMAIGDTIDEPQMLTSQLAAQTAHCVRSVAGGKLGKQPERMFNLGLHPRKVILVVAQYASVDLPELVVFKLPESNQVGTLESNATLDRIKVSLSHLKKKMYWNYRAVHGLLEAVSRSFASPEHALSRTAPQPLEKPKMLFNSPRDGRYPTADQLRSMVNAVDDFAIKLKAQNIELTLAIVPQKEEIYSELCNQAQSPFSRDFLKLSEGKSFRYVDLFALMREEYKAKGTFFHQYDDNHWNENGVRLLVDRGKLAI